MNSLALLLLFTAAALLGCNVVRKVPPLLHTPLMSGTNAISGVTILGSLVSTALAVSAGNRFFGFLAIVLATINLVGGFLITDRMLRMFRSTEV